MRTERIALLFAAVFVALLCISVRWELLPTSSGRFFGPWPDGLEYAAGAQSIVQRGRYELQLGPHVVPPRYPPGFSLMLAPALVLGLDPVELVRLPALFDAAHALLLLGVTRIIVRRLTPTDRRESGRARWTPLVAGLAAGTGWSLTPLAVSTAQILVSDSAAMLLADAGLAALFLLPLPESTAAANKRPPPTARLLVAGLMIGLAGGTRMATGALLAAPVAAVLGAHALLGGPRRAARLATPLLAGLAIVALVIGGLLVRSGQSPWQWSAYDFWEPQYYDSLDETFSLDYAVNGHPQFAKVTSDGARTLGNFPYGAGLLLGAHYVGGFGLGHGWPTLGWIVGGVLLYRFVRRAPGGRPTVARVCTVLGLAAWPLGLLALYSLYFYSSARFFLPAAPLPWVALAVGAGTWVVSSRRPALAVIASVLVIGMALVDADSRRPDPHRPDPPVPLNFTRTTQDRLDAWLALSDTGRAADIVHFDPIVAQARGWLPPRVVDRVGEWGLLSAFVGHVHRAAALGRIPLEDTTSRDGPVR